MIAFSYIYEFFTINDSEIRRLKTNAFINGDAPRQPTNTRIHISDLQLIN